MSRLTIADNPYITVEYWEEHRTIYHVIHQPIGGDPLRSALLAGTEALREYGISKWLSDDRTNGPLSVEDREWGVNYWNRVAIDAGWKYWANVVPEEMIAAGSLRPTMEALYGLGLRLMVFDNVEEAIDWLDNMR